MTIADRQLLENRIGLHCSSISIGLVNFIKALSSESINYFISERLQRRLFSLRKDWLADQTSDHE
ncbi:MAG: hypothetical protein WKF84_26455 [Pyrinomonadaceae bacterium]